MKKFDGSLVLATTERFLLLGLVVEINLLLGDSEPKRREYAP